MFGYNTIAPHTHVQFGINLKFWQRKPKVQVRELKTPAVASELADKIIASADKFEVMEPSTQKGLNQILESYRQFQTPVKYAGEVFAFRMEPRASADTDIKRVDYTLAIHCLDYPDEAFSILLKDNRQFVYKGKTQHDRISLLPEFASFIQRRLKHLATEFEQGKRNQAEIIKQRESKSLQEDLRDVRI